MFMTYTFYLEFQQILQRDTHGNYLQCDKCCQKDKTTGIISTIRKYFMIVGIASHNKHCGIGHVQRLQKLSYLHLSTDCFMKISRHSSRLPSSLGVQKERIQCGKRIKHIIELTYSTLTVY